MQFQGVDMKKIRVHIPYVLHFSMINLILDRTNAPTTLRVPGIKIRQEIIK